MRLSSVTTPRAMANVQKSGIVKVRKTSTMAAGCRKRNQSSPTNSSAITAADTSRSRTMRSYSSTRSRNVPPTWTCRSRPKRSGATSAIAASSSARSRRESFTSPARPAG